jgi:hypothetical protein
MPRRPGGARPVPPRPQPLVTWFPSRQHAQFEIALPHMATFRSASTLISSDGTRTPGAAALFAEPGRKGGTAPWAGDFRPANDAGNGPKDAVGRTFTWELPVTLALMGEDAPPF